MATWLIHPTGANVKPIEVEADEVVELRSGWMALKLDGEIVVVLSPTTTLAAVRQEEEDG